ncbi:NADPH:quinone oxidoreductase family protein [Rhodococcus tukisamuensis]|uniref:NADPH2:quinone reductase n=1 Tax=Rhodococcus tukisamuensis TaxID=168276 RepID=A0A1G6S4U7_9NOCA|nr:NADPH:quinone oxidoreductase family protein [Rhodococcus tukisamuensis]SDD11731.1 NADPH2:quinone reductase [Rhodococcus tukisamuensis]
MKAWRVNELGEPRDVLRFEEVVDPTAGPGQLLVKVLAAPANFPDVLLCRGEYQIKPPLPFTPGVELCGEVVAVGAGVTRFEVGDRVVGNPELPAGAFAELTVMAEENAYPAPSSLDDAEASALSIGYQTSWFALHRRTQIKPGETLLVHAAAGGVGSTAVQLGKAAGATVIGVVGGQEKADYCRQLGADLVIDRRSEDFVEVVNEFTNGRGVDVVYDPVGGDAYMKSTKCIAFEGRILVIGFAGGTIPTPGLNHALIKNYSIIGLHWGLYKRYNQQAIYDCHAELTRMADAGEIKPLISERLSFDDVAEGLAKLGEGKSIGRMVFHP